MILLQTLRNLFLFLISNPFQEYSDLKIVTFYCHILYNHILYNIICKLSTKPHSVISQKKSNFEYWPLYSFSHEEIPSCPTTPIFITVLTNICPLDFRQAISIHNLSFISRILPRIYQSVNPPTSHHFSLWASCLPFLTKMKGVSFKLQDFSTGQGASVITHSFFCSLHAVWYLNFWHGPLLGILSA